MNPWITLWWKGAMLGLEAQQVMGLRLLGVTNGTPLDVVHLSGEKMQAAFLANFAAAQALATSGSPAKAITKSFQVYTRMVRSNRRALVRKRPASHSENPTKTPTTPSAIIAPAIPGQAPTAFAPFPLTSFSGVEFLSQNSVSPLHAYYLTARVTADYGKNFAGYVTGTLGAAKNT